MVEYLDPDFERWVGATIEQSYTGSWEWHLMVPIPGTSDRATVDVFDTPEGAIELAALWADRFKRQIEDQRRSLSRELWAKRYD